MAERESARWFRREPPPPALDLFDLDGHFAGERTRLVRFCRPIIRTSNPRTLCRQPRPGGAGSSAAE